MCRYGTLQRGLEIWCLLCSPSDLVGLIACCLSGSGTIWKPNTQRRTCSCIFCYWEYAGIFLCIAKTRMPSQSYGFWFFPDASFNLLCTVYSHLHTVCRWQKPLASVKAVLLIQMYRKEGWARAKRNRLECNSRSSGKHRPVLLHMLLPHKASGKLETTWLRIALQKSKRKGAINVS